MTAPKATPLILGLTALSGRPEAVIVAFRAMSAPARPSVIARTPSTIRAARTLGTDATLPVRLLAEAAGHLRGSAPRTIGPRSIAGRRRAFGVSNGPLVRAVSSNVSGLRSAL